MTTKIVYVERKPSGSVSIEKVFRQVAKSLPRENFSIFFDQLKYANDALGTVRNLIFYRKKSADIYHITGHVHYMGLLLPKKKTVLTIHDAGILHIRSGLRRFILKKLLFDLPLKRLEYITAVSETTKRELVFFTKCQENKIRVIENPIQDHFYISKKKSFDAEFPVILHIGTTKNKNLPNLIKAIENIPCQLNIIGELCQEKLEMLKDYKISFNNKLRLNDSEMRDEYANADIVSFCSTFEGFGLPIIEAQAMQTPVVTSNISPLIEVAGNAAALADPNNVESIRREILHIINDEEYRKKLVRDGLENVKKYNPEKISNLYQILYKEIIADIN